MKWLLFFALSICSASISIALDVANGSHFKSIAIPLEGLIVRNIPPSIQNAFKPADLISNANGDYYFIRPYARPLLLELVRTGYKIILLTNLNSEQAKEIASQIVLSQNENITLLQVARFVEMGGSNSINIEIVGAEDASTTFFLTTTSYAINSTTQALNLGNSFLPAPSFQVAKQFTAGSIPTTESEWYLEYYNLARAYHHLSEILKGSFVDSYRKLNSLNGLNLKSLTNDAIGFLDKSHLTVKLQFLQDAETKKYIGCERLDFRTRQKSQVSIQECVNQEAGLLYAFKNIKKTSCGVFDSELIEIANAPLAKCLDQIVIKHPKSGKIIKITAFQGIESLSEQEFLKRITEGPTAESPFRLFEPWSVPDKKDHLNYLACLKVSGGQALNGFGNTGSTINEACKLDTLYSWGSQVKLDILIGQMGHGAWGKIKTIFSSRGPLSTFGYGPISIRLKLKKGVRFKAVGFQRCDFADHEEARNTVYVRTSVIYSDWSICNPDVLHSWSHSTPEHYDEMMKEYLLHQSLVNSNRPLLGYVERYGGDYQARSLFQSSIDTYSFSESVLDSRFQLLLKRIQDKLGQIFFNPNLPANERTREEHFKTEYPTYFNEN